MRAIALAAALLMAAAAHAEPVRPGPAQIQTAPRITGPAATANSQDIDAAIQLTMMQTARDADADLRAMMESMQQTQRQKQALREKARTARSGANAGATPGAAPAVSANISANPCRAATVARWKQCMTIVERRVATLPAADRADLQSQITAIKGDLDSMSEMGEMESLRLQMAMDRMSKMMATLSNILKKNADTQASITRNIK